MRGRRLKPVLQRFERALYLDSAAKLSLGISELLLFAPRESTADHDQAMPDHCVIPSAAISARFADDIYNRPLRRVGRAGDVGCPSNARLDRRRALFD